MGLGDQGPDRMKAVSVVDRLRDDSSPRALRDQRISVDDLVSPMRTLVHRHCSTVQLHGYDS